MLEKVQVDVITILARIRVRSEEEIAQIEEQERQRQKARPMEFQHADPGSYSADEEAAQAQAAEQGRVAIASHEPARAGPNTGRHDPGPGGPGTTYNQRHAAGRESRRDGVCEYGQSEGGV